MVRNIRITALLATVVTAVALAVPAAAQAWSIHSYRVRDAGPEIVHKVTVCDPSPRIHRIRVRAEVEADGGDDRHVDYFTDVQNERCIRWSISQRDNLIYEGRYYGRLRISLLGTVRFTGWKSFWSS
jgi:hypothetical protein